MPTYVYKIKGAQIASLETTPELWAKMTEAAMAAQSLEAAVKMTATCLFCGATTSAPPAKEWVTGHRCER